MSWSRTYTGTKDQVIRAIIETSCDPKDSNSIPASHRAVLLSVLNTMEPKGYAGTDAILIDRQYTVEASGHACDGSPNSAPSTFNVRCWGR